jgi:hypothetical protein
MRTELLRVLLLSDAYRATRVGELYAEPRSRTLAEFLIDLEEDVAARAIVVTEFRMMNRQDG